MGEGMRRKLTVKVTDLVQRVNHMLAHSTCDAAVRRGMIAVLETVLHESGNYAGYRFLAAADVPAGELPGINAVENAASYDREAHRYTDGRFDNTDDTRRAYYGEAPYYGVKP